MTHPARKHPETPAENRPQVARRPADGATTRRRPLRPGAGSHELVGAAVPLGATRAWWRVVETAGRQCECVGACGSKHSRTAGRCPVGPQTAARLYAAPRDPAVDRDDAWRIPVEQLAAWCGPCLDAARRHATRPAPVTGPASGPGRAGPDLLSLLADQQADQQSGEQADQVPDQAADQDVGIS